MLPSPVRTSEGLGSSRTIKTSCLWHTKMTAESESVISLMGGEIVHTELLL